MKRLKKKGENYLGLAVKIEDGIREGFCKVWNLTREISDGGSEDGVTRKINLDELDLDMEHKRALIDFGSTTISRILGKKNVQNLPSKSRRDQSASSARSKGSKMSKNDVETSFVTNQKELVSHIILNIKKELAIPFLTNENPQKTWQQFINQHELENLTNNALH